MSATSATTANAFVFIKPTALTPATVELCRSTMQAAGLSIVAEGERDAAAAEQCIDPKERRVRVAGEGGL